MVYVRTRGTNQKGQEVLSFVRWVMVPKRDKDAAKGVNNVPQLPAVVTADRLPVPEAMNLQRFPDLAWAFGSTARWDDYDVGERLDHPDAMTIEEADHVAGDPPVSQHARRSTSTRAAMARLEVRQAPRLRRPRDQRRDGARAERAQHRSCGSRRGTAARTSRRRSPATRCARSPRSSSAPRFRAAATSARCACGCRRSRTSRPPSSPRVPPLLSGTKEPRIVLELDYWALFPRALTNARAARSSPRARRSRRARSPSTARSGPRDAASTVNGPTCARAGRCAPTSTTIAGRASSGAVARASVVAARVIASRSARSSTTISAARAGARRASRRADRGPRGGA